MLKKKNQKNKNIKSHDLYICESIIPAPLDTPHSK
jgi:hypothetical protein